MSEPFLVCLVDGQRVSLPLGLVREAARLPRIEPLPGSPPEVLGVAMVRGAPVGVVDAVQLLRLGAYRPSNPLPTAERAVDGAEARRKKVLVVLKRPLALVVDRIEGVRDDPGSAVPLPLDGLFARPDVRSTAIRGDRPGAEIMRET